MKQVLMNELLRRYRIVTAAGAASVLLVLIAWGWAYNALRGISQPLIIHFTKATGITQIGHFSFLSGVAVASLVGICVNIALAYALEERNGFLAKFIAGATLFLAILIFVGFAAIISVN